MELYRLPTSPTESPMLMARVTEDAEVIWSMDETLLGDEHNWFMVWRKEDVVHVQATMWFHSRGTFAICLTDETPDNCVILANETANMAARSQDLIKDATKWKRTS